MSLNSNSFEKFSNETIIISGIGRVEPGTNIDIFVMIAGKIKQKLPKVNIKYFWVGNGYFESDLIYGVWLKVQIEFSNLKNDFFIVGDSFYKELFNRTDFFIVPSIGEEFPFFAKEALSSFKPILCFEQNSKLVDFYKELDLYNLLVSEYLDIESISEKSVNLIKKKLIDNDYFFIFLRRITGYYLVQRNHNKSNLKFITKTFKLFKSKKINYNNLRNLIKLVKTYFKRSEY